MVRGVEGSAATATGEAELENRKGLAGTRILQRGTLGCEFSEPETSFKHFFPQGNGT